MSLRRHLQRETITARKRHRAFFYAQMNTREAKETLIGEKEAQRNLRKHFEHKAKRFLVGKILPTGKLDGS